MGKQNESVAEATALHPGSEANHAPGTGSSDFDGVKFHLCARAQVGTVRCWSPSLKRVVVPARSGLDVLEVFTDWPPHRIKLVLPDGFVLVGGV